MLIALLIVTSSIAVYYYYQFGQETQAKNQYINEVKSINNKYDGLASNYNTILSLYNKTFSLLVRTISVVNTSEPVYQEASRELSQLWNSYQQLKPATTNSYASHILIDFGNGTRRWYNNTQTQPGWNMYIATVVITNGNVDATWYPQFGAHFVTGVGGVRNTKTNFWFLWAYNGTSSWHVAPVGADQLLVFNGSTYAWTFCAANSSFQPTCRP